MAPPPTRPADPATSLGHVLAAMLGLASIVAGIAAMVKGLPGIMSYTLLIFGAVLPPLAILSWQRSRAAWSFVISICAVFALITLFGAPKVESLLGVPLAAAMTLPVLYTIVVILLAAGGDAYRDQGIGTSKR
jgi:hypothetical protein